MYDIQLRKGGKLFVKVWNSQNNEYSESEVDYSYLNIHLYDYICFDSNVVLLDVFNLFRRDEELFAIAGGCPYMSDFMNEIQLPMDPKTKVIGEGLGSIVVSWIAHVGGEEGHVDIYPAVSGTGLNRDFDLSVIKLNEIAMLPVVLDTTFEIVSQDSKVLFSGIRPFTLLDFSKALLDELGSTPPMVRDFVDKDAIPTGISFNQMLESRAITKCRKCGQDIRSYHFKKPQDICAICFKKSKEN